MEQPQAVVRKLAFYVTSTALAMSAATLARTLYRRVSSTPRAARWDGRGTPGREEASDDPQDGFLAASQSTSSAGREAIVNELNHGGGKGILVAAAVGAVIGAGVALLFAPQSGRESRDWLARRTRGLEERVGVASDTSRDVIPNGVIPL